MHDLLLNLWNSEFGPLVILLVVTAFWFWIPAFIAHVVKPRYDELPVAVKVILNAMFPALENHVNTLLSRVDSFILARVEATETGLDDSIYMIIRSDLVKAEMAESQNSPSPDNQ